MTVEVEMKARWVKLKTKTPTTRNEMKSGMPLLVSRMMPKISQYTATFSSGVRTCQSWPSLASVYMAMLRAVAKAMMN